MFKKSLLLFIIFASSAFAKESNKKPDNYKPEPHRKGEYRLFNFLKDNHPSQFFGDVNTRTGLYTNKSGGIIKDLKASQISKKTIEEKMPNFNDPSWQVYVPQSYDPDIPTALLVHIHCNGKGQPHKHYHAGLEKHNVIWIGGNMAGNKHNVLWRYCMATYAALIMEKLYNIDKDRIWVSGSSGGGRCASEISITYPEIFKGAIYFVGCNTYRTYQYGGSIYKTEIHKKAGASNPKDCKKFPYVFFTGSKDFNKDGTVAVYNLYKNDGFKNLYYIEKTGHKHADPCAEYFEKCLEAINTQYKKEALIKYKKIKKRIKPANIKTIYNPLKEVASRTSDPEIVKQFKELNTIVQADKSKAVDLFNNKFYLKCKKEISIFYKKYGRKFDNDINEISSKLAKDKAIKKAISAESWFYKAKATVKKGKYKKESTLKNLNKIIKEYPDLGIAEEAKELVKEISQPK